VTGISAASTGGVLVYTICTITVLPVAVPDGAASLSVARAAADLEEMVDDNERRRQ